MKKWLNLWGIALLAMALLLAGCGQDKGAGGQGTAGSAAGQSGQNAGSDAGNGEAQGEQGAKQTAYPLTLKDSSGKEFTFESAPQKIVSLAPSETETLFALGLDQQIAGVSDLDDYPEAVKDKPRMGGSQVNVEAVVAAQPDLIVAASMIDEQTVKSLTDLGYKVFLSDPKTMSDVMEHIKTIGEITNHQAQAEEVVGQMQQELSQVTEAVKSLMEDQKKKVYIEFSPGWTVGKGEFMDEMITLAGGVNVASDVQGWSEINEENIIKANPDVILYAKSVVDKNNRTLADVIKGRAGWDQITAIKEDRVVGLDDNLLSRPGPRVTQGLTQVAKAIYPELIQP
ncbi:ABC transporter substrate-binding protein [Paenibacillus macerans]|uniref:ABC transporter substrate-binding protein n=1 Tax=Paenibacillus macerans TaxID=44252 RepID=UPI00203BBEE8|nr:ABC transporter substrate-binding protein [Paenibacillus macerans]MCM3699881.1 ABC transporter substrate-binding protein [Paenibacillus macerans]